MNQNSIISTISNQEDTSKKIPVSLSNELISLLSEQLYQSPLKAIEELVTNSYDAGAENCRVIIPADLSNLETSKIIVYDDGIGMDEEGLTTLWSIGSSLKRKDGDTIGERKIIGKFGIGKLATYSIANIISYVSRKGDTIYLNTLDYKDFRSDPSGGKEPILLPVIEIKDFTTLKTNQHFLDLLKKVSLSPDFLLSNNKKTWTIVILESLKQRVENLKTGRLRWVLSTSMPINPSFKLFLNNENVDSSKLNYTIATSFKITDLPKKRIDSLNNTTKDNWLIQDNKLVSDTFKNGITGVINVTDRTLLGGKSSDVGRSHGFFIKVRGRIINQDDETFGSVPTKMGTFNRMHAIIEADDLDEVITASRENLENSTQKQFFQELLNEVLNEATSKYSQYLKDKELPELRKKEGERNFVNHELMEFSIADTLTLFPGDIPHGGEPDNSFFYADFGTPEEKDDLIKLFYSEAKEKYKFQYTKTDRSERLVTFDIKSKTFWINESHPFIKANLDEGSSRNLLEDFVVAETMLEIYLVESGIPTRLVGEILEKRDRLLIGLANDHPISLKFLADTLRDSSANDLDLEINQVIAVRALGFTAKHIAGSGNPDGIATFNTYSNGVTTITLEAKSSKETPGLSQLDFAGLQEHMIDQKASGCLLIAPSYPGGSSGENAAAAKRAKELKISCWTIEQLANVIEQSENRKITAPEIVEIITTCFTPEEVKDAIDKLLNGDERSYTDIYRAIIKALESLETRLPDSLRTLDSVTTSISYEFSNFVNISKVQVDNALKDVAHISKGALTYREGNIILLTSIEELKQRLSSHTDTTQPSRRNGKFK